MATVTPHLMTAEEFFDFVQRPENRDRRFELEHGEIVEWSRPGKFHGFVCATIGALLFLYAREKRRGYVCTNDTGVVVRSDPDTVRGPDIQFFDDAAAAEEIDLQFGRTPALLAVEVLSPHDALGKVNRRIRDQLDFGTKLVWVVDPDVRNVTVYRMGREPVVLEADETLTGEEVLPGFACRVEEFFRLPGDTPRPQET